MFIDISYPIDKNMAIYPGNPPFDVKQYLSIENGDSANVMRISFGLHLGTHIDVPRHVFKDGKTLDEIPFDRMNGRAKVFDFRRYGIITAEELSSKSIEKDDIVLLKSNNSERFAGKNVLDDYVTLDYAAAEYLVNKRIKMVYIDYMTIERPRSRRVEGKSIHQTLLGNDVLIGEAVNLTDVEEGIYEVMCLPLNIIGADGCPVRVVVRKMQG